MSLMQYHQFNHAIPIHQMLWIYGTFQDNNRQVVIADQVI